MKVIVGLGNPGPKFRLTRHNLGFLVVEHLAKVSKIKISKHSVNFLFGAGDIGTETLLLVKPLTFVNLSGACVSALVKQKKIQLRDLLIVCDDVNLPLGKIRIRPQGSYGGHNGLNSIIEALGSNAFARLRIGVGTPKTRREEDKLSKFVLGKFSQSELKIINQAIEQADNCCRVWATEGIECAMHQFNNKVA